MHWTEIPCKIWPGAKIGKGYGQQRRVGNYSPYVHRQAWFEAHGPVPDGLFVCHHCDTPACYEVAHLFVGTVTDNNRDMSRKGRHGAQIRPDEWRATSRRNASVLTEDEVREIKRRIGTQTQASLAEEFGVSSFAIHCIRIGQTWKWVA